MPLRVKLAGSMVALVALLLGAVGCAFVGITFAGEVARAKDSAFADYRALLDTLQLVNTLQQAPAYGDLAVILRALCEGSGADFAAVHLHGLQQDYYQLGPQALLSDAPLPRDACLLQCTAVQGEPYLQLGSVFVAGDETFTLRCARSIAPLFATRDRLLRIFAAVYGVALALCALLAYLIALGLTRPLRRLGQTTRALAAGDLHARAPLHGHDEVARLGQEFNTMADRLQQNIDALQQAMERREAFMASFAHELKTPMTSIIGYADLLRSDALRGEEATEAAHYIYTEGRRLESLSLKLLDVLVLGRQQLALQRMAPAQLVGQLVTHLQGAFRAQGIRLQYRCQAGECLLEGDLVKSLLVNLLDNARKAMPRGGNIVIAGTMLADGYEFRVYDNGAGIPPEALAHLTEAFYRVDKARSRAMGGVGLGLTLCARIAALHGGSIRFDSRVGNGTCVTVQLHGGL